MSDEKISRRYPTTSMCDGLLLERFESQVRETDVFIVTSAKCGQTWLQVILFHLKTGGNEPSFCGKGLPSVSPWLEWPPKFGTDEYDRGARLEELRALDDPRILKMHVVWEEIPRLTGSGAKVVTITRDPRDIPYSMFAHLHAMKKSFPDLPDHFDDYFERWMEFGFYYKFVNSFWPHYHDEDVLWLRYEDLKMNLSGEILKILSFLEWNASNEMLDRVLPLVDIDHMRRREKTIIFRSADDNWKEGQYFFREGGVGKNRAQLSADQERRIVERARQEFPKACFNWVMSQG